MKPKFTPGPWGIFKGDCGGFVVDELNERYPKNSKAPSEYVELALVSEDQTKPKIANAHLIAAAPDLYEVLEEAVRMYGQDGGPWNVPSHPGSWTSQARAALAKARGEA